MAPIRSIIVVAVVDYPALRPKALASWVHSKQ
jgi:hypothetical protein